MIEEFKSRNITVRAFTQEKNICKSTFESWLQKLRKYGRPATRMPIPVEENSLTPIDVTTEAKEIISEEASLKSGSFTLDARGMKLTFSIKNLNEVLEALK